MRVVRLLVVTGLLLVSGCGGGDSQDTVPDPTDRVTTEPTDHATTGVPTSTATSPPTTEHDVPDRTTGDVTTDETEPPPGVAPTVPDDLAILRSDGLGPFSFGTDADEVEAWLVEQFGQPDAAVVEPGEGGWPMPSCDERRFAHWASAGLTVGSTDRRDGDPDGSTNVCDGAARLAGWFVVAGAPWFATEHTTGDVAPVVLTLSTPDGVGLGSSAADLRAVDPLVVFGTWDVDGYDPAVFRTANGVGGRVEWDAADEVQRALAGAPLEQFQSEHGIDEEGAGPLTLDALGVGVPDDAPVVYLVAGGWEWGY